MNNNIYYNYNRVISYNAFLNILIGERGVGKTYGASKLVVNDFLKKNRQFVYIRRYKTELSKSVKKFFQALIKNEEFKDHSLEVKGNTFLIDERVAGYSMTLSTAQQLKSTNFSDVYYIIFDEFLIEEGQGHYLKNEVFSFLGLIETIARMRDIKVFLLANAVSEINPYFLFFDLSLPYNNDIKLFKDGMILLQYMKNEAYREAKKKTKFGKLVEGTEYEDYAVNNKFTDDNKNFIEKKNGNSKFSFSFIYKGNTYGVWVDYYLGKMYVSNDFVDNGLCFATTTEDHSPNTLLFSIAKKYNAWNNFILAFKMGNLYYENVKLKNISKEVLKNIILRSWDSGNNYYFYY